MNIPKKQIQFHWRLIHCEEPDRLSRSEQLVLDSIALPDVKAQAEFSRYAEEAGMESLLTDLSYGKPDPLLLASGILARTEKMKFLVAIRSGMITPTYFVQQVNTFSAMHEGRILLNIVAGHSPDEVGFYGDFLSHDERYDRTEEFLAICNAYWNGEQPVNFDGRYYKIKEGKLLTPFLSESRNAPYIFIAGGSQKAKNLAISQGSCWMRLPDVPEKIKADGKEVLAAGKEVGLRLSIIARDTKEEAVFAASELLTTVEVKRGEAKKENSFVAKSDSVMMKEMYEMSERQWLTPWLWTGAVKTFGAPTVAMVGTPEELSDAIIEYKKAGVTQFIFSGWPKKSEMVYFGEKIIPLVRQKEELLLKMKALT